jgi:hypothetical protein
MGLMEKIKQMDPKEMASRPEVKALWNKSLFWSLAHRRSFKYPLGVKIPKDILTTHQMMTILKTEA